MASAENVECAEFARRNLTPGRSQIPCMNLSIHTAPEATLTIAADPKHLGASIGITAVLHTWGSALTHHPRVAHDRAGGWHL